MRCKTYNRKTGEEKPKKLYKNYGDAKDMADAMNLAKKPKNRIMAYRCQNCRGFHIGTTSNKLTEKHLNTLVGRRKLKGLKIIGKIELPKESV